MTAMERSLLQGLAALCVVLWSAAVRSDSVADPPEGWRQRLAAVPVMDVSGSDPVLRQSMNATRQDLALLLQDPATDGYLVGAAYGRLGAYYHLQNVVSAALLCYRNAVALVPGEFRWHYYLGALLLDSGNVDGAVEQWLLARDLDPDYLPLGLRLGEAHVRAQRLDMAEKELGPLLAEPGLGAAVSYQLGQIALLRKDYQGAIGYFQRSLELDPSADRVHYPLAQALRASGRPDAARDHLAHQGSRFPVARDPLMDELQRMNEGARPYFVRGMAAVKRQDYGEAVEAFSQGLDRAPQNVNARVSYARLLYLTGRVDQARQQLEAVVASAPQQELAAFLLGLMLHQAGEFDAARGLYLKVLELDPRHAGASFFLADLLFRAGDFAAAASRYAAAAAAEPDMVPASVLDLVARYRSGDPAEAVLTELRTRLVASPAQPLLRYAVAAFKLFVSDPAVQDPPGALALARTLAREMPSGPHLALLAVALAANGEADEAARTIGQLSFLPPWLIGVDLDRLDGAVDAWARGDVPVTDWPADDPVLQPPPVDAAGPMREYPAPLPY